MSETIESGTQVQTPTPCPDGCPFYGDHLHREDGWVRNHQGWWIQTPH